jgi:hypothetical protein
MIKLPDNQLDIITPRFRCEHINQEKDVSWFLEEIARSQRKLLEIGYAIAKDAIDKHPGHMDPVALDVITPRSSKSGRMATYVLAMYFRREFQWDFVQYHHDNHGNERDRVFLWTQEPLRHDKVAVGAICFRWRDYEDAPHGLALAWVWIHPYLRRKGILSAYWPFFREVYGNFYVERPISTAMADFLIKMGECRRCGTRRVCKQCREAEAT